jgi:hypothetical protein
MDAGVWALGHRQLRAAAACTPPHPHPSRPQGDSVYMARTVAAPDPATINDAASWEFYGGGGAGPAAVWTPNVADAQPLFTWLNHTGVVTMTWVPALQRYLMCVGTPTDSPSMVGPFDFYMLESPTLTGPFSLVSYNAQFGPEAYFVHVPSKFLGNVSVAASAVAGAAAGGAPAARRGGLSHACLGMVAGPAVQRRADRPPGWWEQCEEEWRRSGATAAAAADAGEAPEAVAAQAYLSGFLSYSANFANQTEPPNPPGGGYHWSLQQMRLAVGGGGGRGRM